MAEESYWVRHPELIWAPAKPDGGGGADAKSFTVFRTQDEFEGKSHSPEKKKGDTKLAKVKESQLHGVPDVCRLEEVNDGALLHSVRTRYNRGEIYTYVSQMLIALNPFRWLPIYSKETMQTFLSANSLSGMDPHIFGTGFNAFKGLSQGAQAVLVSGESGAGKTESAKLIIKYVAEAVSSGEPGTGALEDKIMEVNPVLESFGNATTERNNNSSRFGKWTQITMSDDLKIQGCTITDYLLELTRVCGQGPKDRNYHIFFQLIQARGDPEFEQFGFGKCEDYMYLKGARFEAPGIDDKKWYGEIKEAFNTLGFSTEIQMEIFRITMGILTFGNIQYQHADVADADGSAFVDTKPMEQVAKMLGVNSQALSMPLLQKVKKGKSSIITVPRTTKDATSTRDSIARLLYGRLFKWLVAESNRALGGDENATRFFGVLDIAGFESFAQNDLEQLFINYANELLQQHFNNAFFKMELEQYKAEGLDCALDLSYKDNSDIVDLIRQKGGIFPSLDEESTLASGKAENFVSKVCKTHAQHARMVVPKMKKSSPMFGIQHFAGVVEYTCDNFLDKNMDSVPAEAPDLLMSSELSILKTLGHQLHEEVEAATNQKGSKKKTVSIMFQKSLEMLMSKLDQAHPHFIRCIKPNKEKVANKFTSQLVLEQLLYSGVFEAIAIRQSGFATRLPFSEFLAQYAMIAKESDPKQGSKKCWQCFNVGCSLRGAICSCPEGPRIKELSELSPSSPTFNKVFEVLQKLCEGPDGERGLALGKSKVFLKSRALDELERKRDEKFKEAQKQFNAMKDKLTEAIQGRSVDTLKTAIDSAEAEGFGECELCDQVRSVLFEEQNKALFAELKANLEAACGKREIDALKAAIARAEEITAFQDDSLAAAKQMLDDLERRDKAALALQEAIKAPTSEKTQAALQEAEAAGVDAGLLQEGRAALKKEEARAKIQDALCTGDLAELEAAMDQGKAAGLLDSDLDEIKSQAGKLKALKEARETLAERSKGQDVEVFDHAVQEGIAAGLEESEILPFRLQFAAGYGEARRLRTAIAEAEKLDGFANEWLAKAKESIAEAERKEQVTLALEDATRRGDIQSLRDGIKQGETLGVQAEVLDQARAALAKEEQKEEARKAIKESLEAGELDKLESAFAKGEEVGLTEAELTEVRASFEREKRKAFARADMTSKAEGDDVRALQIAIDESRAAGVATDEVARCQVKLALKLCEVDSLNVSIEEALRCGLEGEQELTQAKCTLELIAAIEEKAVQRLKDAIENGERANVAESVVANAKAELEKAERKREARERIVRALGTTDVQELKQAFDQGREAGLDDAEIAEVNKKYEFELCKAEARRRLEEALLNPDPDAFRAAMEEGVKASLAKYEIEDYRFRAGKEERRRQARTRLELATIGDSIDLDKLRSAIAFGREAELGQDEIDKATKCLEDEENRLWLLRKDITEQLQDAIQGRNAIMLHIAIMEAEDVSGIDGSLVQRAREALAKEERKAAIVDSLEEAMTSRDIRLLHVAVSEGREWGVDQKYMRKAESLLHDLKQQAAARGALAAAARSQDVTELSEALLKARVAGLEDGELQDVKLTLGAEQRKLAALHNLQASMHSRKPNMLRDALTECYSAGVTDPRRTAEAERALDFELSMLDVKERLDEALATGDKSILLEAMARAKSAGLSQVHLKEARAAMEDLELQERRKVQVKKTLEEAMASRSIALLHAALAECRATRFDAPEVETAEAILHEEKVKEQVRAGIVEAAHSHSEKMLLHWLLEAQKCGLAESEIRDVREKLGEEERKVVARANLWVACNERSVRSLAAAIADGEACALEAGDLVGAKKLLELEQAKEEKHKRLVEAMQHRHPEELDTAIQEASHCGADADVLEAAMMIRDAEVCKSKARQRVNAAMQAFSEFTSPVPRLALDTSAILSEDNLSVASEDIGSTIRARPGTRWHVPPLDTERATLTKGLSELREAIVEGEEVDLERTTLDPARDLLRAETLGLLEEGGRRYLKAKEHFLCPARELTFELACRSLQSDGHGSLPEKTREAAPVFDATCSEAYVQLVQGMWFAKRGNILTELCTNLKTCTIAKDARPGGIESVGRKQLVRLCMELQSRYRHAFASEQVAKFPLMLLCMLLYTQQDVDTDRMLLFPDCPAGFLQDRESSYRQYRDRIKASREERNPTVASVASWSAWASWGCISTGRPGSTTEWNQKEWAFVQARMVNWVKLICLLSAIQPRLDEPRTVTRCLVGLADNTLNELRRRRPGEPLFWAALLSASLDEHAYDQPDALLVAERSVVLKIAGVRQGLELLYVSQYPGEREVLLPAFSLLRVRRVCDEPGRPLLIECDFHGTLMPSKLQQSCWYDLMEASRELMREILELWPSLATPSIFSCLSGRSGAPQPGGLQPGKITGHYTQEVFKTAMHVFEGMDRRGVWSISREDYVWASSALSESPEFQRLVMKKEAITDFFLTQNRPRDLSLHRFLCLSMPGANEADMERMLRWAVRFLRRREKRGYRGDHDVVLDEFGEDVLSSVAPSRPMSPKGAASTMLSPPGSTLFPADGYAFSTDMSPLGRSAGGASTSSLTSWRQRPRGKGAAVPVSPGVRPWK